MNYKLFIELIKAANFFFSSVLPDTMTQSKIAFLSLKARLDHSLIEYFSDQEKDLLLGLSRQIEYQLDHSDFNLTAVTHLIDALKSKLSTCLTQQAITFFSSPLSIPTELTQDLLSACSSPLFDDEQKGLTLFLLARQLSFSEPQLSYYYTQKAFEYFPELTSRFAPPITYHYKPVEETFLSYCPICKSIHVTPYFNAQIVTAINFSSNFAPSKLWMKCKDCQSLFAYNFPKDLSTDITYPASQNNFLNQAIQRPHSTLSIFSNLIRTLKSYTSGSKYLEVGVGTGEFLAVALEMGLQIDAVEILPELCQQMKALLDFDVTCMNFLDYPINTHYDVITMGDVIEHLQDPVSALHKAHDLLTLDGLLWISTPNYESSFSKMMKFSDPMWLEPWHYTYFCRTSFQTLLESCGFKILDYQVSGRYNGSMELLCQKIDFVSSK